MRISAFKNQCQLYPCTLNNQNNFTKRMFNSFGSDKITFSGGFSKLERQALEAVRAYASKNNTETCRVIKNGKDITRCFNIIETEAACKACPQMQTGLFGIFSSIFKYKHAVKNSTYIHSHTRELPLSPDDIIAAIKMKNKKMVSITPKGKYMSIELDKKSRKKAWKDVSLLFETQKQKYNEMSAAYGDRFIYEDRVHMQEYANFALSTLKDFFEKTGLKVETNFY